jgi:hypothetical protein
MRAPDGAQTVIRVLPAERVSESAATAL